MKKIVLFVVLGLLTLGLVGCEVKNSFEVGGESNIEVIDKKVELSIKEDTLSNTGATLILKNNSNVSITYGNPYKIEIMEDGKWHEINVELFFTMEAFELQAGEEVELELNWENDYGKLAEGKYRIIKSYAENIEKDDYSELYASVEFDIEYFY